MADALGSSLRQSCRAARLSANLERGRATQCPAAPRSFPVRSVHQRSARQQLTVSASFDGDIPEECVPVLDKFSAFERVKILSEALPYLQRFQGKTIVIKYGGAAMKDPTLKEGVIKDLVLLACVGIRPVLVHGGGPEINSWLNKVGIEAQFKNGLRVTDAATMEVVEMVLTGRVNKSLVTLIQQAGGRAVGLCGKDSEILQARQMVEKDIGYVGEVTKVNAGIIETLVRDGYIPVLATVASSPTGESLNVNADIAAGELAAALRAEKLILMTDVPGVMKDKDDISTKYTELDIRNTRQLVAEGIIAGGMIPKVECCVRCLAQGVAATHIIDGRQNHSLLMELLTDEGVGTMIVGSSRGTPIHQQEQQIREAVAA